MFFKYKTILLFNTSNNVLIMSVLNPVLIDSGYLPNYVISYRYAMTHTI